MNDYSFFDLDNLLAQSGDAGGQAADTASSAANSAGDAIPQYDLSSLLEGLSQQGQQAQPQEAAGQGFQARPNFLTEGFSNAPQTAASGSRALTANRGGDSWWDSSKSWLQQLMKGDKDTLGQAKFGLGALGLISSLVQQRSARNSLSPSQLQGMLKSQYSNWTPGQQTSFNNYFYQPLPKFNPQPVVGLARGGRPHMNGCPCQMCQGGLAHLAHGGTPLVRGQGGGQSDQIHARLSPGEYVMDADVVSALGDGSNDEGAKRLDQMREEIRRHKRGASPAGIPPKALSPLSYLKGDDNGA